MKARYVKPEIETYDTSPLMEDAVGIGLTGVNWGFDAKKKRTFDDDGLFQDEEKDGDGIIRSKYPSVLWED